MKRKPAKLPSRRFRVLSCQSPPLDLALENCSSLPDYLSRPTSESRGSIFLKQFYAGDRVGHSCEAIEQDVSRYEMDPHKVADRLLEEVTVSPTSLRKAVAEIAKAEGVAAVEHA